MKAPKAKVETVKAKVRDEAAKAPVKKIDYGKIIALKDAGWTSKQIADEMKMTEQAVNTAAWKARKEPDKYLKSDYWKDEDKK